MYRCVAYSKFCYVQLAVYITICFIETVVYIKFCFIGIDTQFNRRLYGTTRRFNWFNLRLSSRRAVWRVDVYVYGLNVS